MAQAKLVDPNRLPGLFLSSRFEDTARRLVIAALSEGFEWVDPTPLMDSFWHTTFTPSSSEIIFRLIERSAATGSPLPEKVVTLQPCIRALDLAPWSDGRHLLYFHMVTYFWFTPIDLVGPIRWTLDAMHAAGAPIETSLFSYFKPPSPVIPEPRYTARFGSALLDELGINRDRQIPISGSANYHLNDHRDETGAGYEAWGPRIELFAGSDDSLLSPLEFATLVLEGCKTPRKPDQEYITAAAAIGVERLAMAAHGISHYWQFSELRSLVDEIIDAWELESNSEIIASVVRHALEILHGLVAIASTVPELSPSYKGVAHQLRRLVKGLSKELNSLGISIEGPLLGANVRSLHWDRKDLTKIQSWLS